MVQENMVEVMVCVCGNSVFRSQISLTHAQKQRVCVSGGVYASVFIGLEVYKYVDHIDT